MSGDSWPHMFQFVGRKCRKSQFEVFCAIIQWFTGCICCFNTIKHNCSRTMFTCICPKCHIRTQQILISFGLYWWLHSFTHPFVFEMWLFLTHTSNIQLLHKHTHSEVAQLFHVAKAKKPKSQAHVHFLQAISASGLFFLWHQNCILYKHTYTYTEMHTVRRAKGLRSCRTDHGIYLF